MSLDLHLPVNAQPTDALAFRFASWRKIIRALNVYFKDFASAQDDLYRANSRLVSSVNFPFFQYGTSAETAAAVAASELDASETNPTAVPVYHLTGMHPEDEQTARNFLPFGSHSIADVPAALLTFHQTQSEAAHRVSKELVYHIIPRLEDLRRDLLVKIKEIKNLASDFKNSVDKEQHQAHRDLAAYVNSIEMLLNNSAALSPKNDPYLLKQAVGKQLTRQINEENYLLEAYLNIQASGKELERVVVQEIQSALNAFGKLVGAEAANIEKLLSSKILSGYATADSTQEWDAFIARDANFVDPSLKLRNIQDVSYPNMNSSLAYEIRSGYLERRSKYLKSYSRAWYVLTPAFLHEFKSPDRRKDPLPVMSISLSDCLVELDKKSTSGSHKFTLNTRSARGHKWVFRAESQDKLNDWFTDVSTLSNIDSPVARALKYFPSQDPVEPAHKSQPVPTSPTISSPTLSAVPVGEQFGAKSPRLAAATGTPLAGSRPLSRNSQFIDESLSPLEKTAIPSINLSSTGGATSSGALAGAAAVGAAATGAAAISLHPHHHHHRTGSPNTGDLTPVLSNTSEVTSIGEPFGAGHQELSHESLNHAIEEEYPETRKADRGRFPSELGAGAAAAAVAATSGTVDESVANKLSALAIDDDASSVFSYDLKHETNSTLPYDTEFEPVHANIPVHMERRLTQTNHKEEALAALHSGIGVARGPEDDKNVPAQEAVIKRRDSVISSAAGGEPQLQRRPSRKPTGSYGVEDGLQPLTSPAAAAPGGLFFAGGLPQTTSSAPKA